MHAQMRVHNKFSSRVLDQEPDMIARVPKSPDTMIIGTYSLVETHDDANPNRRKGSLQILPFSEHEDTSLMESQSFRRIDFHFGIYDIQFHPQYPELLGVATSDAQILFFAIRHDVEIRGCSPGISLIKLGEILIEERRATDNQLAIITQFQFVETPTQQRSEITAQSTHNTSWNILLAATTQFGNTKLVKAKIPLLNETSQETSSINSDKESTVSTSIQYQIIQIHKQAFDLEAWTTLPVEYQISPSMSKHLLLLSGGDDGQLLISHLQLLTSDLLEIDLDLVEVTSLLTLRKDHQAGVTNICDLGQLASGRSLDIHNSNDTIRKRLILTGSYDELLRLFLLTVDHASQEPPTTSPLCSMTLLSEVNLGGGVWKIKKLDEYSIPLSHSSSTTSSRDDIANPVTETHYVLLVAGHTSGAHVVRLIATSPALPDTEYSYQFNIEKNFIEGHKSLVYAVEARQVKPSVQLGDNELEEDGHWEVISTSFYDKKICHWDWVDEKKGCARQ